MKEKLTVTFIFFIFFCHSVFPQIGITTPFYRGKDSDLLKFNWASKIHLFYPIFHYTNVKDTSGIHPIFLFQPAINWEWYNFEKNLIISRHNGKTNIIEDPDFNHDYKNNSIFRTTSLMQTTALYMPVNVIFVHKKLKGFTVAPGLFVEYLIGGKFKRKYSSNGTSILVKEKFREEHDYYGFQRFQYGLCGHISYRYVTIYGIYSMMPLFKPTENIDVNRFNVGILFNLLGTYMKPY